MDEHMDPLTIPESRWLVENTSFVHWALDMSLDLP
jgi:hypothetical protein